MDWIYLIIFILSKSTEPHLQGIQYQIDWIYLIIFIHSRLMIVEDVLHLNSLQSDPLFILRCFHKFNTRM